MDETTSEEERETFQKLVSKKSIYFVFGKKYCLEFFYTGSDTFYAIYLKEVNMYFIILQYFEASRTV